MTLALPIYLDYNATTPVDPRVFEAMSPYFTRVFGNAASRTHAFGREAEAAVLHARNQVAGLLNAEQDERHGAREIIWTSGATEANNLAIKGVADACREKGRHLITQTTEHKAVLDPCKRLAEQGWDVTVLPVDRAGRVSARQVADAIRADTVLVSIMYANNEVGTVQPIREIGAICKERGVIFHTDATQAVGKLPIDVQADGIDLLSLSAHKLYGPKGVGALYVRKKNPRVRLTPLFDGGAHERGFRSGTLNVPGIVGLGLACELAAHELVNERLRLSALRDRLQSSLTHRVGPVVVNGDERNRLPHVANLSFPGLDGTSLLNALDDVAVSSGSACTSASLAASHVLMAMGLGDDLAHTAIRFSLGRFTTLEEIDYVVQKFAAVVPRLRNEHGADCGTCEPRSDLRTVS
ncbi:MAG: IscS subfamily cysteine desulfurase [Phycisphaerales bacterium]|nr:IscS subfamily cysteine desulfurase [Phycisphaerales bacterium]MDB5302603.1 IscS subfamily cysteine desulfurase [Phycisphaerales bacterium]